MLKSENKRELEVQLHWNRLQKPSGGSCKGIYPRRKEKLNYKCLRLVQVQKKIWHYGWGKDKISELHWVWKEVAEPSAGNKGT